MADNVPSSRPPSLGTTSFGPYVLVRRLGRGGMAEAFLAERTGPADFRRRVCLKLILPDSAEDKEFIGWFFDEAKIHAQLHHEHIVQVYEFGEHDGRNYLALEFVDGCDLRTLMHALEARDKLLPVPLAVKIVYELASALECAHKLTIGGVPQKLVHRDLSPANVLLSVQGNAKLSDFGVVKAASRVTRTETGMAKGKVPYMSPEQMAGSEIDGRTDLFALGVIFYELLAGRHPYRQKREDADIVLARRIVAGDRPALKEVAPHVPDALCRIVDQMLEPDVQKRVARAEVLLDLLAPHTPGPHAGRELRDYVEAGRSASMFPATAIGRTGPSAAPFRASEAATISRTEVVPKDVAASSASPGAGRPVARSWMRWGTLGFSLLVAGVTIALLARHERASEEQRLLENPARTAHQPAVAPPTATDPVSHPTIDLPSSAPASTAPSADPPSNPDAVPPNPPEKSESPVRSSERGPTSVEDRSTGRAKASLRVVVLPFGDVEVSGVKKTAPAEFDLTAGSYSLRAGRTAQLAHRKMVRLKPGERREVIIDLAAGE